MSVLLVDDEEELLDVTKRWLEMDDCIAASTSSSAQEALRMLKEASYDVVVSDYQMPRMNGIELLKRLRAEGSNVPFILFTGRGREDVVIEALNNGASFYLQKSGEPRSMYAELGHKIKVAVDRVTADRSLRDSEERFRQVANSAGEFIWETDAEGLLTYVSPAFETILGYSPEEVVGKMHFYELLQMDEKEALLHALKEQLPTSKPIPIRGLITANRRKDGTTIYCEGSGEAFYNEAGMLVGYRGVNADITEKKRAQDELYHSHQLLDDVVSNARSAIAVHDRDLRYIYVSKQYLREYRVTENVIGKHHYDVFPDLPEKWRRVHQQALAGEICSGEEDPYFRDDGSVDWTRWECRPWYERDGSIGGIIVYTEVISTTKTQKELRHTYEMLDQAMDISKVVNWEYDVINDTFTFDDRFFALYGTSSKKEGSTKMSSEAYAREFLHPEDRHMVAEEISKTLNSEEKDYQGSVEHRIVRRDGQVRHIIVRHRVIRDDKGKVVRSQGANQDITDLKVAELSLRRVNRCLALLNSITRHDVLNQTMIAEGCVALLDNTPVSEAQRAILNRVQRSQQNIQAQMEFAKIYQEVGAKAPAWQDLQSVMADAFSSLPMGSLEVRADVHGYEILADPLFKKVAYNLVENALRHSGAENLYVECHERGEALRITISDDGQGVEADMKESIFDAGVGRNTGYGLFLAREVLGITGFTIVEEGASGEGAKFVITVPPDHWRTHI